MGSTHWPTPGTRVDAPNCTGNGIGNGTSLTSDQQQEGVRNGTKPAVFQTREKEQLDPVFQKLLVHRLRSMPESSGP